MLNSNLTLAPFLKLLTVQIGYTSKFKQKDHSNMELLFIKSKEPLTIESYFFDTMKDATSFYTQHSNEKIFVGFYDADNNKILTLAESDSDVEVYNKFIENIIDKNTEVTHVYKDSLFAENK